MGSSDPTSLKGLFQGLVPDPCGALQGKVISASPLKIQATNDDKLIIPASLLIVPKHLTNYKAVVDIAVGDGVLSSKTTESGSHDHSGSGHSHSGGTHTHNSSCVEVEFIGEGRLFLCLCYLIDG